MKTLQGESTLVAAVTQPVEGGGETPAPQGASSPAMLALGGPVSVRSVALSTIVVLLVLYTFHFAAPLLMPMTLAVLVSVLLAPVVRGLERLKIHAYFGAFLTLMVVLAISGAAIYALSAPATQLVASIPEKLRRVEYRLRLVKEPLEQVQKAAEEAGKLTKLEKGDDPDAAPVQVVQVDAPSLTGIALSGTPRAFASLGIFFVLLFFLLSSGGIFLNKLVRVIPRLTDKKRVVGIVRAVEREIATYLLTITMINAGLGVAVAAAMALMGVPNPILWGVLAGVFNFAPYMGPVAITLTLALVGMVEFYGFWDSLRVPLVYVGLTVVEGQLLTPLILGRRLTLNPVVVFLGIVFWGWMWGVVGALIAVPMLVSLKITLERVKPLAPVAEFLGR